MRRTLLLTVSLISACGKSDARQQDVVERGRYLANHVFACVECHTPRNPDRTLDRLRLLAGVPCLIDLEPSVDGVGCLPSGNLTPDATGQGNRTDAEIKNAFLNGRRPDGTALASFMPYWLFHDMTAADADAIVAYLRSLAPVVHRVPPREAPWDRVTVAAAPLADSDLPPAGGTGATLESARRGRHLATICVDCHTPDNPDNPPGGPNPKLLSRLFEGGKNFGKGGQPIFSANLTPDVATGIGGMTVEQIVKVLREGTDRHGEPLCPPMPSGPNGAFGGLTVEDATDIASYLLHLPPRINLLPSCVRPGS